MLLNLHYVFFMSYDTKFLCVIKECELNRNFALIVWLKFVINIEIHNVCSCLKLGYCSSKVFIILSVFQEKDFYPPALSLYTHIHFSNCIK